MRIVNLAHGALYALGAYVSAWIVGSAVGHAVEGNLGLAGILLLLPVGSIAIAAVGALIEPKLLRPLYRLSDEYHLLVTLGLLLNLRYLINLPLRRTPLSARIIIPLFSHLPLSSR